jgi:hypothetical protein
VSYVVRGGSEVHQRRGGMLMRKVNAPLFWKGQRRKRRCGRRRSEDETEREEGEGRRWDGQRWGHNAQQRRCCSEGDADGVSVELRMSGLKSGYR